MLSYLLVVDNSMYMIKETHTGDSISMVLIISVLNKYLQGEEEEG